MLILSELCPLNFNHDSVNTELERTYIQKFATTDNIVIQMYGDKLQSPIIRLFDYCSNKQINTFIPQEIQINTKESAYNHEFKNLKTGIYYIKIWVNDSEIYSDPFIVTDLESDLKYTSHIKYTHKKNDNYFNTIFKKQDENIIFHFRIEAEFKSSGNIISLSNETFRNQFQEVTQLYSVPYLKETFTIGNAEGVPMWIGNLINKIFCLSDIEIDEIQYVRSENSVPEKQDILEDYPFFNYQITLEKKNNLPGIVISHDYYRRLRAVDDKSMRKTEEETLRAI